MEKGFSIQTYELYLCIGLHLLFIQFLRYSFVLQFCIPFLLMQLF